MKLATLKSAHFCGFLLVCVVAALSLTLDGAGGAAAQSKSVVSPEAEQLNDSDLEHFKKKEYEGSIRLFREALQLQPEFPEALDNLGKALDATGKDDEALSDFDKALKLAPQDAAVHCDKGLALLHEKRFEESATAYR
jgi:tetratricopeptide (TPR) repeat protein